MYKKLIIIVAFVFVISSYSQEAYYNDVNLNLTGLTLKNELATKITRTHSQFLFYDQVWDASKITDVNPANSQEVLLIYGYENGSDTDVTNDRIRRIDDNGGSAGQWNREHVYSQSLGTPSLSTSGPGADAHHLRPADAQRNSSRNNRKFTNGTGNSAAQANGGWFPGDEWKGDVARMMMYLYVRYDDRCLPSNIGFGSNTATPDDMIDLFLQWNVEDPVSDIERQRNAYHENTENQNAQGNRNPFIDNPILATRIWGGENAEDSWRTFTSSDIEAPSAPTNLRVNTSTTFSVNLSWDAASDNIGVTSYDVYIDGNLVIATSNTSITISNLNSDTNYSVTVLAKDIVNNSSVQSQPLNVKTLKDTEAPSIPKTITVSNETESSFVISWSASTDNTKVTSYEIYIDDILKEISTTAIYTATGLMASTTYKIEVLAVDAVGNKSALSSPVNATTSNGSAVATELFFSEYLEGSSNNKALEIVNLTTTAIDLAPYSIMRQSSGGLNGADWEGELSLAGKTINSNDVFVIVNEAAGEHPGSKSQKARAAGDFLIAIADSIRVHDGDTNFASPINFNGDDPVGLFKDGVLIDVIGTYNGGIDKPIKFGENKTLRRKSGVSQPNINFDLENEWDVLDRDNADDFGSHSAIVLSVTNNLKNDNFIIYPNPVNNFLQIKNSSNKTISNISVFDALGKRVIYQKSFSKEINIQKLSKGIYTITFIADNSLYFNKFIKN